MDVSQDLRFLGWSGLDIRLGRVRSEDQTVTPVILEWQPGDIRNCSYAPKQGWIGITAEDRIHGQQVLAIYDTLTKTGRTLLRGDHVLRHCFNRAGTEICYTQPSRQLGSADLFLYDLGGGKSRRLVEAAVAHGSTPAWFRDDVRIAYSAPEGEIKVFNLIENHSEVVVKGSSPAIHPDGGSIALQRADGLFIFDLVNRTIEPLQFQRKWLQYGLKDGLSWSPDGRHLSFGLEAGVTGKETVFYLLDSFNQQQKEIEVRNLRGLIMI
jgi:hypothetical protein